MGSNYYSQHVDSITGNDTRLVIGLSNLDGNIWDGSIRLLLRETGEEIAMRPTPAGITMVRFAGEGDPYLLATRDDGNVVMYAVETLEEVREFAAHDDIASAVSVDKFKEGNFATVGWEGDLCLWDWRSKSTLMGPTFAVRNAHHGAINDVQYNPANYSQLCTVGKDGYSRVWDSRTGKDCVQLVDIGAPGSCLAWEVSRENRVTVGTDKGELLSIDCRMGAIDAKCVAHRGRVRRILSPPSGANAKSSPHSAWLLLSVSDDTTVAIWKNDGTSSQGYSEVHRFSPHTDYISDAVWLQGNEVNNTDDVVFTSSTDKSISRNYIPKLL